MATADTKHSIVVRKNFTYRGDQRNWTNRYHFEGDLPTSQAAFEAFADLVVAAEKAIYDSEVTINEVVCYDASTASSTNPHGDAVYTKTYTTDGTLDTAADGGPAPGDAAIYLRYSTPARSSKNHPVYLANYFHGARMSVAGGDAMTTGQRTAVEDYADQWLTGFTLEGSHRERCGPRGAVATGRYVSSYIRHRDFPT